MKKANTKFIKKESTWYQLVCSKVGLDSTIIPTQVKNEKQRNDNNKFALRNTKIPIAQNHLQSGHLFGGVGREGGVPHANYVAQLDLEKSTTYPCIFVTLIY